MNTEDIMALALELAGFDEVPPDSQIYVPKEDVKRVLFGIDVGVPGLLLAKQLGCDLAISHHPEGGSAAVRGHEVFLRHVEIMKAAGVPEDVAREAVREKFEALRLVDHKSNYDLAPSVARLLGIGYMNIHCPLDEVGRRIMQEVVDGVMATGRPTVRDLMVALSQLREFELAETPIFLAVGDETARVGKAVVAHGAFTNGGHRVARAYFEHGVDTVIYIHLEPGDLRALRESGVRGNLIVTGHIASDSVGINPLIDELESRGIEVITYGGIIR